MDRQYVRDLPSLEAQIEAMSASGVKAEIQCMESPTEYFRDKIERGEWV